jgi:uncharacterized protein with GYD domain
MARIVVLVKFTEKGITTVKDSPARASQFKALAAQRGVNVEAHYWLLGAHDGMLVLSAPDEQTITALVLHLANLGFVQTCMCRAYDEAEFQALLGKM